MAMTEKNVFYRLLFSLVLLLISLVTSALAWGHWAYTLDTCPGYNCGCILFGSFYSYGFAGGHIEYCQFITFSQIPVFVTSVILTFYIGYRVCIKGPKNVSNAAKRSNPLINPRKRRSKHQGGTVILDSEPPGELEPASTKTRIVLLILSVMMALLLLSAAVTATTGFYYSCKEYRRILIQELAMNGNAAEVVGSRMSCVSVFDFLDYLQPDRKDYDEPLQYSRKDRINTGVTLMLAKTALFMNFMNWMAITVFHVRSLWSSGGCCKKKNISYQS